MLLLLVVAVVVVVDCFVVAAGHCFVLNFNFSPSRLHYLTVCAKAKIQMASTALPKHHPKLGTILWV